MLLDYLAPIMPLSHHHFVPTDSKPPSKPCIILLLGQRLMGMFALYKLSSLPYYTPTISEYCFLPIPLYHSYRMWRELSYYLHQPHYP